MSEHTKKKLEALEKKSKIDAFNSQTEFSRIQKIYLERLEKLQQIERELTSALHELHNHISCNEVSSLLSGSGICIQRYEKKRQALYNKVQICEQKKQARYEEFKTVEVRYESVRQELLTVHTTSARVTEKIGQLKIKDKEASLDQEELILHDVSNAIQFRLKYNK